MNQGEREGAPLAFPCSWGRIAGGHSRLLQSAGDVRTPTEGLLQSAGDVRTPTEGLLQLAGDVRTPTEGLLQSAGDVRTPTEGLLQSAGDVRRPTVISCNLQEMFVDLRKAQTLEEIQFHPISCDPSRYKYDYIIEEDYGF